MAINQPDFGFLIDSSSKGDQHVLYRDHGKGCIHRIFILFNIHHTCDYCHKNYMILNFDGFNLTVNLIDVMKNSEWPFLVPLNKNIPDIWTGEFSILVIDSCMFLPEIQTMTP